MAYIYQIQNDINGKLYVGKTEFSIEKRFKEHCRDAFKDRNEKRPLYSAMRKYGVEHFHVSLIEKTDNPEEREKYWIEYLGTFKDGYNATIGGDGKRYIDYELIIEKLFSGKNSSQVAKEVGCSTDIVYMVAHNKNIKLVNDTWKENFHCEEKEILCYDKNNSFVQEFNSIANAARWCRENHLCGESLNGVRSHISECAKGKRKTAYQYIWKYK